MTPHIATLTLRAFQDEFAQALLAIDSMRHRQLTCRIDR